MTVELFLQLMVALGSGGVVYGTIRADIKNMIRSIDDERRLRELHEKDDDETHHDIRGTLQEHHGRIARIEGNHDLVETLVSALRR